MVSAEESDFPGTSTPHYDIVRREPAHQIQNEYCLSSNKVADWVMFCSEPMLVFMEGCSEKKNRGPNKTVEIDESKFGR